jgi:LysR family transcriptional regulator, hca operon transcriptional activator
MSFGASPLSQVGGMTASSPSRTGRSEAAIRSAYQADLREHCLLLIEIAGRLEKDFVSWAHACEIWEVVMELRHLRYFIAVADAGSLTVAAEQKLHTSQPSLSRQIRDLEQEVGVQLINRSAHGIELTSAGKAFLDHARTALLQAEAAKEAALRSAHLARPTFALGFLSGSEIGLLPEVSRILREDFPGIEIRLSSDYSPALAKALMRGKLEAAFMRLEEHMGDLAFRRVRTDPLIFVFPNDHRLASQEAVAPEEIANEAFLLPSNTAPAVRRVVLEFFAQVGVDPKPEHEVHNVVHAISMIASMRAVMLLPAYTKRFLPDSVTTRPVKGEAPTLDLIIAYSHANTSPILKLLLSRVGKLGAAPS